MTLGAAGAGAVGSVNVIVSSSVSSRTVGWFLPLALFLPFCCLIPSGFCVPPFTPLPLFWPFAPPPALAFPVSPSFALAAGLEGSVLSSDAFSASVVLAGRPISFQRASSSEAVRGVRVFAISE